MGMTVCFISDRAEDVLSMIYVGYLECHYATNRKVPW